MALTDTGTLLFCTPNGTLGALDTKSGGLLWSTQVVVPPGSMQAVTLTAVGGAALVGLDPPNAYSDITQVAHVDAGSGELVKVITLPYNGTYTDLCQNAVPFAVPASAPDMLLAGYGTGSGSRGPSGLFAVNVTTGRDIWITQSGPGTGSAISPAVFRDYVFALQAYTQEPYDSVWAFNLTTGATTYPPLEDTRRISPVVVSPAGVGLFYGTYDQAGTGSRTVSAWDVSSGNITWQASPFSCWGNSPLFGSGGDNVVYSSVACLLSDDDKSEHALVFALNATDGDVLWTFNATQPLYMFDYSVVGADGTLIVYQSQSGTPVGMAVLG